MEHLGRTERTDSKVCIISSDGHAGADIAGYREYLPAALAR